MNSGKKYNYCLDFIKGIACIFVVLIHCKFPGRVGLSVQAVARFAVPFFFMVSGYYCFRNGSGSVGGGQVVDTLLVRKKILRIAKITFWGYLFYCLFFVVENWLIQANHTFDFSIIHILKVALFNEPSNVPPHFWFLFALINVYILYFFIVVFKIKKIGYIVSLLLFVVLIGLQQGASLMGYSIRPYYFRNFLFEGFPFFMLGYFLHDIEGKWKVSNRLLLTIIILSSFLSIAECYVFKKFIKVFLSTYPLVISLFVYAINNPNKHKGAIQLLGKNLSLPIYILHWFVMIIVDRAIASGGFSGMTVVQWTRPVFVIGMTILFSFLYDKTLRLKKA